MIGLFCGQHDLLAWGLVKPNLAAALVRPRCREPTLHDTHRMLSPNVAGLSSPPVGGRAVLCAHVLRSGSTPFAHVSGAFSLNRALKEARYIHGAVPRVLVSFIRSQSHPRCAARIHTIHTHTHIPHSHTQLRALRKITPLTHPCVPTTNTIVTGGESTTMALVAERTGIMEPLREWVRAGKPVWVCVGV